MSNALAMTWGMILHPIIAIDTKKPLKLTLFDKEEIIKVAINTGKQDNNYFEYNNKNTIEKIELSDEPKYVKKRSK